MEKAVGKIFSFDEFEIDSTKRLLLKNRQPVTLNPKSFDLLLTLVEHSGEVVSKNELLDRVWANQYVEENNLTVHVAALRKALGEKKNDHRFIVTVPGQGYTFVGDLHEAHKDEEFLLQSHAITRIVIEEGAKLTDDMVSNNDIMPQNAIGTSARLTPSQAASLSSANTVAATSNATVPALSSKSLTLKSSRRWLWLGIATALILVLALTVFFTRSLQHKASVAPFQQISLKKLTNSLKAEIAALSPDGKLYAYVLNKGRQSSLWLGHINGGESIELRPDTLDTYRSLTFSPDSNSLYYVISGAEYPQGALCKLPVFGGAPEKLRDNVNSKITFSPDLKQFAYIRASKDKQSSTLVIANTDDATEKEIASRSLPRRFSTTSPAWSPNGKTIAVSAVNDDASATAYELFSVAVVDGQMKQLTREHFGDIYTVSWVNNQDLLIVAIENRFRDAQIWYVSSPVGEVQQVNPDLYHHGATLSLSADGNSLLAIQVQTISNIWVAPADNLSQAKRITFGSIGKREGIFGLDWTPQGKLIYSAFEDKSRMLWEMEADGSKAKPLTPAGYEDEQPSLTADGRIIVFESNRSGSPQVWSIKADGSDMKQLTFGDSNEEPCVSPDGKWVVYISTHDGERTLQRISLDGGEPIRLTDRPASWPRVSPDGKWIACGYTGLNDSSHAKLAILPIAGGQPVKLLDVPDSANFRYSIRWLPDGKAVTYRDWENGIWKQDLNGSKPERLAGLPQEKLHPYAWSPNGKFFAFTRGLEMRDVILISSKKSS